MGFFMGIITDRFIKYWPYLKFDFSVNILDGATLLITISIGVLIPVFVNKLIEEKKGAKIFIVDEIKDFLEIIFRIKKIIFETHKNGIFKSKDRDDINYIFHEAELKINCIREQIKEAFDDNHEDTCTDLVTLLMAYKNYITGGELMNSNFVKVDERYFKESNTEYSKIETDFKIIMHSIHKF